MKLYFEFVYFIVLADRSRLPSPGSVGAYDEPDNVISPAGHLMRTELNEEANDILDAVDFEVGLICGLLKILKRILTD